MSESSAVSKKQDQQVAQSGSQGVVESKEQSASASANVRAFRRTFELPSQPHDAFQDTFLDTTNTLPGRP